MPAHKDISGTTLNGVYFIKRVENTVKCPSTPSGKPTYLTVCPACGKDWVVSCGSVKSGNSLSCCGKSHPKDITGETYNLLTAIRPIGKSGTGTVWECSCSCGGTTNVPIGDLVRGHTKSCGCLHHRRREDHPLWKGGNRITRDRESTDYKEWRTAVFHRDRYTCQKCGEKGGVLRAHHLNGWTPFPELRFDIDNGVTLCYTCHNTFHSKYGKGNNTRQQYNEWIVE